MKVIIAGKCEHEIVTTNLNGGWNVRCFTNGILNQEIRVQCRADIGVAAADMLRWEDKVGNHSDQASASRERFNKGPKWRAYNRPHKVIPINEIIKLKKKA